MDNIINVDARTKETVIAEVKATIEQVSQTAILGTIKIGRCFSELKELVPHGEWYQYIEENVGYSAKKVERFMKISAEYGDENTPLGSLFSKTTLMSDLSYTKALSLLALPNEEVENFVENNDVENLTVKELEGKIKDMKIINDSTEEDKEKLKADLENEKWLTAQLKQKIKKAEEDLLELKKPTEMTHEAAQELKDKQKEIDKLLANLEKSKAAEAKAEEKLAKAIEEKQDAVETARAKAIEEAESTLEEIKDQAKKEASKELEEAKASIEKLSKELEAAGNEDILLIKIKSESMQTDFETIIKTIETFDAERNAKMKKYLTTVLTALLERIEA